MATGPGSQRPAAIAAEAAKSIHFMGVSPGRGECERGEQTMKSVHRSTIMFMLYSGSGDRVALASVPAAWHKRVGGDPGRGPWGEGKDDARFRDRARLRGGGVRRRRGRRGPVAGPGGAAAGIPGRQRLRGQVRREPGGLKGKT